MQQDSKSGAIALRGRGPKAEINQALIRIGMGVVTGVYLLVAHTRNWIGGLPISIF